MVDNIQKISYVKRRISEIHNTIINNICQEATTNDYIRGQTKGGNS